MITRHEEQVSALSKLATSIRRRDLAMIHHAGIGHIGGDFSAIDILVTLYFAVLRIDPQHPDAPDRDRFILSKGHAAGALRSEEHTSELQSQSNIVCRLLLENK